MARIIRIEKSSKTRTAEYMLLYRLRQELGNALVERAIQGNTRALDKLEKVAWSGRNKRRALVQWVEAKRAATANQ